MNRYIKIDIVNEGIFEQRIKQRYLNKVMSANRDRPSHLTRRRRVDSKIAAAVNAPSTVGACQLRGMPCFESSIPDTLKWLSEPEMEGKRKSNRRRPIVESPSREHIQSSVRQQEQYYFPICSRESRAKNRGKRRLVSLLSLLVARGWLRREKRREITKHSVIERYELARVVTVYHFMNRCFTLTQIERDQRGER